MFAHPQARAWWCHLPTPAPHCGPMHRGGTVPETSWGPSHMGTQLALCSRAEGPLMLCQEHTRAAASQKPKSQDYLGCH